MPNLDIFNLYKKSSNITQMINIREKQLFVLGASVIRYQQYILKMLMHDNVGRGISKRKL